GLEFSLIEPWKIQRDPDALSRDPQGGLYWIHQEWLDFFVLKKLEKAGRYFDVDRAKNISGESSQDPFMTPEAIRARKDMIWERSQFRTMLEVSEFWGIVLSPKGEELLPRATYTIAGGRVIQKPEASPYPTLRWPGGSFSPLPDILRFGGRGLLEGVLGVWEAINNIMCLHLDALQWIVNPETEVNVDALVDPADVIGWPGKTTVVHETINGQAVKRTIDRKPRTSEILANTQYLDQVYQRGSLVPENVMGLPGWRKNVTWRESQQALEQALGVFGMMGENLEDGAIRVLEAAAEVLITHASYADLTEVFTDIELSELGIFPDPSAPNGVVGIPAFDGNFHVSGIQSLMKDNETLQTLKEVIIPLAERPRFAPYINPLKVLRAIEVRTNMKDEGIIATDEEAAQIAMQQAAAQARIAELTGGENGPGIADETDNSQA
ncbi:MAG: hypothetical protein KKB20_17635, partial [Proteobacteria bacterium]|nr:hypothetical protein [Pseudomonadota bacterium]